ncbi:RNA polymerase III transcription factor IIIC subunit-domain-containing protein [Bombardia bombarda]|uniref:RNA polymerase III transcription factor IIIC subunit-domain-containing protein n=1 Tax=Bombardia bombarda TaxID=252184 RepID=A0AA40CDX4_9PEZI|nr:RNA polymerase III transcription factor IIIC subunit-domain-containing protein [Bombardia bombarda]
MASSHDQGTRDEVAVPGDDEEHAPLYPVPARRLGALEHPMIIMNVDKAVRTFGQNYALQAILDSASPQISVPLYLRYDNPTVRPLTSHNALTHNVVVKVTVPQRTGRKRKRGTNDPFEGPVQPGPESVSSKDRLDTPRVLRRKLADNVDKYTIEPIGVVTNTHRYRGLADFQYAMGNSKFMSRFVDKVLPGDVAKLKEFALEPGIDPGPSSADSGSEYERVVNTTSRVPAAGYFIAHDEYPVPTGPRRQPDMSDPQVATIMTEMWLAMEERPIWTRRSMWNRLGSKFSELPKSGSLVRHCLQYAGYQFKGGPWRDSLVRYGLDPRSDPKYRVYQTLIFKLHKTRIGTVGRSWQAVRRNEVGVTNFGKYWQSIGEDDGPRETHVFDGEAFSTDGKVWQVCDITDPLLKQLFENAEVRSECDVVISGFYHRVLWSVAKAIMKCKMLAIRFGRTLTDDDFGATLDAVKGPNDGGDGGGGGSIGITLPDLQLTPAECEQLRGQKMKPGLKPGRDRWEEKRRRTHYRVRIPLKETEEREAEKMIRLLSMGKPGHHNYGTTRAANRFGGSAKVALASVVESLEGDGRGENAEFAGDGERTGSQAEEVNSGTLQALLDGLEEEEYSEDDDDSEDDEEEEENEEVDDDEMEGEGDEDEREDDEEEGDGLNKPDTSTRVFSSGAKKPGDERAEDGVDNEEEQYMDDDLERQEGLSNSERDDDEEEAVYLDDDDEDQRREGMSYGEEEDQEELEYMDDEDEQGDSHGEGEGEGAHYVDGGHARQWASEDDGPEAEDEYYEDDDEDQGHGHVGDGAPA